MNFLYQIVLHLLALFYFPKILLTKKGRKTFLAKLGKGFPKVDKGERPLIWIHAVSLGETKSIVSLVKRLQAHPTRPLVLLSTATLTGHEEGKKALKEADYHVFMPFDVSYIISPIVKNVAPDLVLVAETDFWPCFQRTAKRCGASLCLVSGKLSEKSLSRHQLVRRFSRFLLEPFDRFLLQSALHQTRFSLLGVSQEKMSVTGNLKLDGAEEVGDVDAFGAQWKMKRGDPILTFGSTHRGEEEILVPVIKTLLKQFPLLKVFLVPRHPERFDEVAALLTQAQLPFTRSTEKRSSSMILVDEMGLLKKCYALSQVAFVAGSFIPKIGGHNILEPLFFSTPVLFGPHMHAQSDFRDLVLTAQAGLQVTEDSLLPTLTTLLTHPPQRTLMATHGRTLLQRNHGSLSTTLNELLSHFPLVFKSR